MYDCVKLGKKKKRKPPWEEGRTRFGMTRGEGRAGQGSCCLEWCEEGRETGGEVNIRIT